MEATLQQEAKAMEAKLQHEAKAMEAKLQQEAKAMEAKLQQEVLTNCQIVMKAWGFGSLLDSPQTLKSVFKRLPIYLQKLFCNKLEINSDGHLATFEELTCFVKQAVQRSNTFLGKIMANSMATRTPRQEKQRIPSRVFTSQVAATSEISNSTVTTDRTACVTCGGNHPLYKCNNFHKLPVPECWSLVKSQRNCFNCLGQGHMSRECKSQ